MYCIVHFHPWMSHNQHYNGNDNNVNKYFGNNFTIIESENMRNGKFGIISDTVQFTTFYPTKLILILQIHSTEKYTLETCRNIFITSTLYMYHQHIRVNLMRQKHDVISLNEQQSKKSKKIKIIQRLLYVISVSL